MKNILITGGSGLVGKELTSLLLNKGYQVGHLGRTKRDISNVKSFVWSPSNFEIEPEALHWANAVVHLAGHSVADGRWTEKNKKLILDSRVDSTRLLREKISELDTTLDYFVSASAIGLYGYGTEIFTEEASAGSGFLAEVVTQWEKEIFKFEALKIPTSALRIGVVLSTLGGAYEKIVQPIKLGVGAPLGSGEQLMSWIHVEDLARMFLFSLEHRLEGAYNAVSSDVVSNTEMTKAIAKELDKPLWLPNVPSFVLKLLLGEMSEVALKGANVSNKKIKSAGFQFKFDKLEDSVKDLSGK